MLFEERTVLLENGKTCVLRPAVPEDADAMIEYLKTICGESPFLLSYPDEITYTTEGERAYIELALTDKRSVQMNAYVDGVLAGNCALSPIGSQRRVLHRTSLGIAIRQAYCGLGIGRAMIDYLCELAVRIGYEQIELEVIDGNDGALRFYERCGFAASGRHVRALKYDDGTCRDDIIMMKRLDPPEKET